MLRYIRFFDEPGSGDVPAVGGKNAALGELSRALTAAGVRVPGGFALTAEAYRHALDVAEAWGPLHDALDGLDPADLADLARRAGRARTIVYEAGLPEDVAAEVLEAHRRLEQQYGEGVGLAVRSSATAEHLPAAGFAGQHESYLDVHGGEALLEACRRCFASLFTDRAVHYRLDEGFDHFGVGLSVGVMRMVRSDLASAGVLFTLDTESGFRDVVLVTGAYGLGENLVQGAVEPDEFLVHKPTYGTGHRAVLRHRKGAKATRIVLSEQDGELRHEATPVALQERYCLTDEEVLELTGYAIAVERRYGRPMDLEWAKDGLDGRLYLVQARPETVASQRGSAVLETYRLGGLARVAVAGRAVGARIAAGPARVVGGPADLPSFRPGEVLVADTTTPDWEPVMRTAAAIVTNRGGRVCHAAILARELGIPAVVGTGDATRRIASGAVVTVSCAEGDTGRVYKGRLPFTVDRSDVSDLPRPRTKVLLNLADPDRAFGASFLPNDGVGLARTEFVVSTAIGIHPLALVHPERISSPAVRRRIRTAIAGYPDGAAFFVDRLAEGLGTIAAAFHPKPVVIRMTDFRSNEYAALLGGADFEPAEANPMLGFRGASRYAHPAYEEGFALECRAIRRVREELGLTNVIVMIPFVRRLAEADLVLARMAELGLERGRGGLQVHAMCEVPNTAVLADAFAQRFDGFSIGSNDLTQLTLGVDRDNEVVAFDYDERDEGVKTLIRWAVEACRRNGIHSGLCGQTPSDHPDMVEFLVGLGIDSISVDPDSVLTTTRLILDAERQAARV